MRRGSLLAVLALLGVLFTPLDGPPAPAKLFSVEHGPSRDDEVNLLRAGGNAGWDPNTNGSYDPVRPPPLPRPGPRRRPLRHDQQRHQRRILRIAPTA